MIDPHIRLAACKNRAIRRPDRLEILACSPVVIVPWLNKSALPMNSCEARFTIITGIRIGISTNRTVILISVDRQALRMTNKPGNTALSHPGRTIYLLISIA
jgi:hypothetical protein